MLPRVLVFIIDPLKKHSPDREALNSVMEQDYPNFDVMTHYERASKVSDNFVINHSTNISINRNAARRLALSSDAEYFLILNSTIVLPKDAISRFILQTGKKVTTCPFPDGKGGIIPKGTPVPEIHIQGGWYPIYCRSTGRLSFYPGGKFVADNTILQFKAPEPSLIPSDYIGLGCTFVSREVLESIKFEAGVDTQVKNLSNQNLLLDESGIFGVRAYEKGYRMYMNGDVICKHKLKGRRWANLLFQCREGQKYLKTKLLPKSLESRISSAQRTLSNLISWIPSLRTRLKQKGTN